MSLVVDVSVHNGAINWTKAKESGVKGALIRCGYGRDFTKYDDGQYKANMDGALANGIKVGVYLYSYAKNADSARSEAQHALRLLAPYKEKLSLPVYYDLEEKGTEAVAKSNALIFGEILERAGYEVGIYASEYWWTTYLRGLDRYTKWVAKWGKVKPTLSGCELWQYDAYGKVNGIGSGVDLDQPFGRLADIINGTTPAPTPEPTPKPTEDKVMIELDVLRKGSKGEQVKTLQRLLKELGYKGENKKVLSIDGSLGGNTTYALGNFQKDRGLKVDYICGGATWAEILKG